MIDAPPPKRHRWGRRVLFLLLLLVILGVSASLWLGSVASARLEAELARVRDAGEPLTLAELAPPPVPEAENAAPLLLEAFELAKDEPAAWFEGDRMDGWEEEPFAQDDAVYAELAAWVASNGPALEKAREAAARPRCRYDLDWERGIEMEVPQLTGLLTLSRVRKARAILAARDGDVDGAIAVCADMVRLAEIAAQDPLLINMLLRAALVDASLDTAQDVLAQGPASTDALRDLLARLDALPEQDDLGRIFVGERAFGSSAFATVRRDPGHELDGDRGLATGILFRILPGTMLDLDYARYLSLMRRQIELARRPYRGTRAAWSALELDLGDIPWYAVLSPATLGVFPVVVRKWTSHEAGVDLARLGLALALHQREHGALPASLADLPGTLRVEDPYRDAPYVLEPTGDGGFVVYSVGPDGDDDGGAPFDDDEQGDLVWRQVAYP